MSQTLGKVVTGAIPEPVYARDDSMNGRIKFWPPGWGSPTPTPTLCSSATVFDSRQSIMFSAHSFSELLSVYINRCPLPIPNNKIPVYIDHDSYACSLGDVLESPLSRHTCEIVPG